MNDPPPRKPPRIEPFRLLKSEGSGLNAISPAETVRALSDLASTCQRLEGRVVQQTLAVNELGVAFGQRMDVLHEELALLRNVVTTDHAPRLEQVERTAGQKATHVAALTGKYASYASLAAIVLRAVAKQFPEVGDAIEGVLNAVGL